MKAITNLLVREHSRRHEKIFNFALLLGGILSGELGGADEATATARSQLPVVGQSLGLQQQVIEDCLAQKSFEPFRDYLRQSEPKLRSMRGHSDVFLVHGHNEGVTHEVARFLEKLSLRVVILREQVNSGRTIIDKFTDYSNVRFAVVLLTADDRGGSADKPFKQQALRARQNVIFELGFFIGKLGRHKVCTLYQTNVEIPSDYAGVLFVPIDTNGAWRLMLAREIKEAGLPIDINKVI